MLLSCALSHSQKPLGTWSKKPLTAPDIAALPPILPTVPQNALPRPLPQASLPISPAPQAVAPIPMANPGFIKPAPTAAPVLNA